MVSLERLVLGTVQWGMRYGIANQSGQPSRAEVRALLDLARQAGVSQLDTARAYGESEAVIGALESGDFRVFTKLPACAAGSGGFEQARESLAQHLAQSRSALGRERFDALLLHDPADRLAFEGRLWAELRREREAGQIALLGVSARSPDEATAALVDPSVEALQVASSLLDQRLLRGGFFEAARRAGKHVFVRSVLLQGVAGLQPGTLPEHLQPLAPCLSALGAWSHEHGFSLPTTFLLFMRDSQPFPLVVGCETAAQLEAHLTAWQTRALSPTELGELASLVPTFPERLLDPSKWP